MTWIFKAQYSGSVLMPSSATRISQLMGCQLLICNIESSEKWILVYGDKMSLLIDWLHSGILVCHFIYPVLVAINTVSSLLSYSRLRVQLSLVLSVKHHWGNFVFIALVALSTKGMTVRISRVLWLGKNMNCFLVLFNFLNAFITTFLSIVISRM